MNMSTRMTTLPHWAFEAIAKSDIGSLIDRCEHETIVVTRQGQPDLVMISHAEWTKLNEAAMSRSESNPGSRRELPSEDQHLP